MKDSLFIFKSGILNKRFSCWNGYGSILKDYYAGNNLDQWNKFLYKYRDEPTFGFISYELLYRLTEFRRILPSPFKIQNFPYPLIWWGAFKNSRLTTQKLKLGFCVPGYFKVISPLKSNILPAEYVNKVKTIQECIKNGDVYQVNLSFRIEGRYEGDSLYLYKYMDNEFRLPYSIYFSCDKFSFFLLSPELLLLKIGDMIYTRPVKGTLPKEGNTLKTAKIYFKNSIKEKRELDMIIDVERNDFYKICEKESVKVIGKKVEIFPNVYHNVATVRGKLYKGFTLSRIIEAIFPSASVTGAPKSSAIKIISQMEPHYRFIYTGGVGFYYKDLFLLAMGLRCIIFEEDKFHIYTGSGITYLSRAQQELKECEAKINNYRLLLQSLSEK